MRQAKLKNIIQTILDCCYLLRTWLVNYLAYYSLRLYGLENVALNDVRTGRYSTHNYSDRNLDNAKELDLLLSASKECLDNAKHRRTAITDKCKTLITISSVLMGLVGFLTPKALAFEHTWMRLIGFLAILALMNTITLLLVFFGVGCESEISIEQDEVELDASNLKKSMINGYLLCQTDMDNRTNYLVDLYKSARFFALFAFAVFVGLFSVSILSTSPKEETERILLKLRSDPVLTEMLRGPRGEKGKEGQIGPKGERGGEGQVGPMGERGDEAVVDEDAIVKRILESLGAQQGNAGVPQN
ncbi:hypothetical protein Pla110_22300 [Polystyrenella longa]|uniref:Collagen triple helix repeat (20 copies) n=1 Tax=Polystyrenella longa TaxID=2528007 RepID=A0A518CMQ0_9PLAN|nr:collagen-like protein [Polystyrenella longa]QDU80500.1 hypothetical protein Pla110_22300 [Polystyrenella longa]